MADKKGSRLGTGLSALFGDANQIALVYPGDESDEDYARERALLESLGPWAGMDLPLTDDQKKQYLSQYAEYQDLEQRLGKSTKMTIAPVVKFYPADRKALEDLLAECR